MPDLLGFEWAISVPGTIGGAVLGNAGAHGGEVKDNFEYGYLIDETGEVRQFDNQEMAYGYREQYAQAQQAAAGRVQSGDSERQLPAG